MLHRRAVLEIVFALDVRIRPPLQQRLAERDVVARADFVVFGEIVAVQIAPGPRVRLQLQRVVALCEAKRLARHVLVECRFDRRGGVAEWIVGESQPRRDVSPIRHPAGLGERACRDEPAGGQILLRNLAIEVVEADAEVQRDVLQRPRVLRVQAEVRVQMLVRLDWCVVDAHGIRYAVPIQLHNIGVDVAIDDVVAESPLEARPQGVAAGHVRGGGGRVVFLGVDSLRRCRNAVIDRAAQQVLLANRREPRRRAAILADARLVQNRDVLDVG